MWVLSLRKNYLKEHKKVRNQFKYLISPNTPAITTLYTMKCGQSQSEWWNSLKFNSKSFSNNKMESYVHKSYYRMHVKSEIPIFNESWSKFLIRYWDYRMTDEYDMLLQYTYTKKIKQDRLQVQTNQVHLLFIGSCWAFWIIYSFKVSHLKKERFVSFRNLFCTIMILTLFIIYYKIKASSLSSKKLERLI